MIAEVALIEVCRIFCAILPRHPECEGENMPSCGNYFVDGLRMSNFISLVVLLFGVSKPALARNDCDQVALEDSMAGWCKVSYKTKNAYAW